jgi:hypothetical protein
MAAGCNSSANSRTSLAQVGLWWRTGKKTTGLLRLKISGFMNNTWLDNGYAVIRQEINFLAYTKVV